MSERKILSATFLAERSLAEKYPGAVRQGMQKLLDEMTDEQMLEAESVEIFALFGDRRARQVHFNINQTVKVKLNPSGLAELERQHEELYERARPRREFTPPTTDEEGFSRWQLWDLMSRLGHLVQIGCETPFETEIILLPGT